VAFPGFIGKKRGMTQVFTEDGSAVPVTVVEMLALTVTQIKTLENDDYTAVQVGFVDAKAKHLTKAQVGHLKNQNSKLFRKLKEFRVSEAEVANYKVMDVISPFDGATFLTQGTLLDVTGQSIGKGFQGGIKRWNHHRGPMSHGSKSHRLPGSIGAGTTPGRVFKGLQMAGKMGNERVTVKHLQVIRVIPEKNIVLVKGAVPGVEGGLLTLRPSAKQLAAAR
jgi:large subunit ribosomal protein L3